MSWREALKKPAAKPAAPKPKFDTKDDDWETDIAYENSATEKSQRYGSASVPGSGRVDHIDFSTIHDKVKTADSTVKEGYQEKNPNRGYGGKYGTEQVMDKAAADFSYKADIKKHSSQTDGKKGFGGEHGIDERAKDASAVGFDYKATVEKHSSQTDSSKGFGGKYGTDQNVQDKSAVGFSHKENVPKHSSQKDYTAGFGGKYGVQKEEPSRLPVADPPKPPSEPKVDEKATPPVSVKADVGNIRARFENMKKEQEAEATKRVAEERNKRATAEQQLQQKLKASGNDQEKPKQKETVRQPSPPRPQTPTQSEVSTPDLSENVENRTETETPTTNEEKTEEPAKFVGEVNVSALLRQRKSSSSSPKNDDDEWAVDKDENNEQRSPSSTPATESAEPANTDNGDGLNRVERNNHQNDNDLDS